LLGDIVAAGEHGHEPDRIIGWRTGENRRRRETKELMNSCEVTVKSYPHSFPRRKSYEPEGNEKGGQ
jgi:hypothetical protein